MGSRPLSLLQVLLGASIFPSEVLNNSLFWVRGEDLESGLWVLLAMDSCFRRNDDWEGRNDRGVGMMGLGDRNDGMLELMNCSA